MASTQHPSDSDTESESSVVSDVRESAAYSNSITAYDFPPWDPRRPTWSTSTFQWEDIGEDTRVLREHELLDPLADSLFNSSVLRSSARILGFVAHIPMSSEEMYDISQLLNAFSMLVDPALLNRLFEHRKVFREAYQALDGNSKYTNIVTWVDEFIAKLCIIVPALAIGSTHPLPSTVNANIQIQKHGDAFRAACQLPDKWQDIKNVIGSLHSSPAAKRTGLCLLFAAYVMRQCLLPDNIIQINSSAYFLEDLIAAAKFMSFGIQSPSITLDNTYERVPAAMLISLISVMVRTGSGFTPALTSLQLQPETLDNLSDLVWMVMGCDADSFLPFQELDPAQVILLRWGNTVPWSWSAWNDQRYAGAECLRSMTSTWLYHLNKPLFPKRNSFEDSRCISTVLQQSLFADVAASSCVISCHLNHILTIFQQSEDAKALYSMFLLDLLGKLCWASIQFLEANAAATHPLIQRSLESEFAKCFLLIFCDLGSSKEGTAVEELMLEALCLIDVDVLSPCLETIYQTKRNKFIRKIEQAVRKSAGDLSLLLLNVGQRGLSTLAEENINVPRPEILAAKCLLGFLTIIYSQKTHHNDVYEIIIFYIDAIVGMIKGTCRLDSLLAPILTVAYVLRSVTACPIKAIRDEEMYFMAIHAGHQNLVTTSVFSQFVLCSNVCDPLLCYEAWGLLSTTLTAIIEQSLSEDEEPLALLSCTTICLALRKLICTCYLSTRRLIISSPWTVSMGNAILGLFDGIPTSPYHKELSLKLADVGKSLNKLISACHDIDLPLERPMDAITFDKLIYYRNVMDAIGMPWIRLVAGSPRKPHVRDDEPISFNSRVLAYKQTLTSTSIPYTMSTFRSRSQSSFDSGLYLPSQQRGTSFSTFTKRCHPQLQSSSCSDSDDDIRHRGKRRRRNNSLSVGNADDCLEHLSWPAKADRKLETNHVSQFPTTPSAFGFFPSSSPPQVIDCRSSSPESSGFQEGEGEGPSDLARLRTSAFWELRQSVTENGEGLVRRMRDYERSRSRHQTHQKAKDAEKRGRKRVTRRQKTYVHASEDDEEDDVLISSGDASCHIQWNSFLNNKRSRSLDVMDVENGTDSWLSIHHTRSQSSGPPSDTHYISDSQCGKAPVQSNDALHTHRSRMDTMEPTPALSHSSFQSANSSLLSLALPPSVFESESALPSTASEKALAALSLALENGAGSITDYSSIWKYQEQFNLGENHDHGELWK